MQHIIIVHWSKNTGPEPLIQYPPIAKFPAKDLYLKIWALHELDKESSMIEYIPEMPDEKSLKYISIIHKYEGEIYFLVIIYQQNAKFEKVVKGYPDILAVISKNLIELINTNKITRAISEAFFTINNYTKVEKEVNLLNFFKEKIKYIILQILRNGILSKQKLNNILNQEYGFSTANIDLIIISFIRENLIVKKSVPGNKECYLLIKDLSCTRIPPNNFLITNNKKFKDYKQKLIQFFSNFDFSSDIENKIIIKFLMDKEYFSLLKKLREKGNISVSECLDILNNKDELFQELLVKKFIYETEGSVFLFSDIRFIKFTPYYIIKKLSDRYTDQEISLNEYLTHLKLIVEQFEKQRSLIDYEII